MEKKKLIHKFDLDYFAGDIKEKESKEERRKRRKTRWGGNEHDKTFIPGMPTVLPTNLTPDQERAYLCKLIAILSPLYKINKYHKYKNKTQTHTACNFNNSLKLLIRIGRKNNFFFPCTISLFDKFRIELNKK